MAGDRTLLPDCPDGVTAPVAVRTIMDRYGVRTKTEAVDLALRHLAGQPMTREEALACGLARPWATPRKTLRHATA